MVTIAVNKKYCHNSNIQSTLVVSKIVADESLYIGWKKICLVSKPYLDIVLPDIVRLRCCTNQRL